MSADSPHESFLLRQAIRKLVFVSALARVMSLFE
jgi:hypothetical protein